MKGAYSKQEEAAYGSHFALSPYVTFLVKFCIELDINK